MNSKQRSRFMRFIVNFWTIVTFVIIIWDVTGRSSLSHVLGPVLAIYTGALALYSAEKEFERWKFYFVGRHPGEVYVVLWTVLLFGIVVWDLISGNAYNIRPDIIATYIVVLGILAITQKSKVYFREIRGLK